MDISKTPNIFEDNIDNPKERKCASVSDEPEAETVQRSGFQRFSIKRRLKDLWTSVARFSNTNFQYVRGQFKMSVPEKADEPVKPDEIAKPKILSQKSAGSTNSQISSLYDDDDDETFKPVVGKMCKELADTKWCTGEDVCGADFVNNSDLHDGIGSHSTYFDSTATECSINSYSIPMSPGYLKRIAGSRVEKYAPDVLPND